MSILRELLAPLWRWPMHSPRRFAGIMVVIAAIAIAIGTLHRQHRPPPVGHGAAAAVTSTATSPTTATTSRTPAPAPSAAAPSPTSSASMTTRPSAPATASTPTPPELTTAPSVGSTPSSTRPTLGRTSANPTQSSTHPAPKPSTTSARDAHPHHTTPPVRPPNPAVVIATRFVTAWATGSHSSQPAWLARLSPLCDPEFVTELRTVNPANVPATTVTGAAHPTRISASLALVTVPTDAGPQQVTAINTGHGWQVTQIAAAVKP